MAAATAWMVDGLIRWVLVFFGVLLVIAGVLSLISPENTFAGIADMLGFLFLIVGIFWIVQDSRGHANGAGSSTSATRTTTSSPGIWIDPY